jgi:integrase
MTMPNSSAADVEPNSLIPLSCLKGVATKKENHQQESNLIFANPDGTPLKPDSVSASVSLLCRRLGLPKGASLHTLRLSHGSTLLVDGVDLATVSERLGHSSASLLTFIRTRFVDATKTPPGVGTTSCNEMVDRVVEI